MKKLISFVLCLSSFYFFAQTSFNSETYQVTLGDLETNTLKRDSTANALVIYEYGKSYVDKHEFDLRTEVKYKIKILNREGFDNANVVIHLYNNKNRKEQIKDILATTYNINNGEVIRSKLDEKDIYRERYDENHSLIKFTLPNIKEGSIVTYSYTKISPFMFKYHGWNFQSEIPKLYSEYEASIPANWLYHIKLVGGQELAVNDSKLEKECLKMYNGASANCSNSRYVMKNIPAFIEEDYMTSKTNYLARIEYELETFQGMDGTIKHYTKTWDAVDKELRTDKDFGRQLKKNTDPEMLLSSDIINEQDPLKKAKAIYEYVQNSYNWNGDYSIFNNVSIKKLIKEKTGNVSSINILLHNLLLGSDIDVKPVLISTRNNGFPTTIFPVLSDFNYQIVQVTINNKTYLLDATDDYLSFGEIPLRCLNGKGRLLDFKNGSKWIDITPQNSSVLQYQVKLNIDDNQTISGKVKSRLTGYPALNKRKKYAKNNDSYVDDLYNSSPFLEISNHHVTSTEINHPHFSENYTIKYLTEDTVNRIYLNPFAVKYFNENPFKLQERTYPIDFGYSRSFMYVFHLNFGETYKVKDIPDDINLVLPNNKGYIKLSSLLKNNELQLMFKIHIKDSLYNKEYYPYLKEFMSKIVSIQNNSFILLEADNHLDENN